ncbi:MAG: type II secretion system protein [Peptococcaceae bacterium]|nr:type II secretion system protein [Peptococcaceae bacterium]
MKKNQQRPAFTLVELIVVLAILAVLLVVIVPRVTGYVGNARETAAQNNASAIMHAAELYIVEQDRDGKPVAAELENGGALDAYIENLDADDRYTLHISYNESTRNYDISGSYTSGEITVTIPDMTIERGATTTHP